MLVFKIKRVDQIMWHGIWALPAICASLQLAFNETMSPEQYTLLLPSLVPFKNSLRKQC